MWNGDYRMSPWQKLPISGKDNADESPMVLNNRAWINELGDGEYDDKGKFIRTFIAGDYDAEFNNALSLDQSVIITALCRQASYDKSDNWVLRNHIELENVKGQLQEWL